jgi:hypothetical protein
MGVFPANFDGQTELELARIVVLVLVLDALGDLDDAADETRIGSRLFGKTV